MSLESTLRGLAGEIGKNRSATGAEAAPAKLRHRTGIVNAYTAGDLTATVQVGADLVDAPFVASYTPTAGDAVSVLINNGSPLILGAVNKSPGGAGVIAGLQLDATGVSVTATLPGAGSSNAAGINSIAIGDTAVAGIDEDVAIGYLASTPTNGGGRSVAIGFAATAGLAGAISGFDAAVAVGAGASALEQSAVAVGDNAAASKDGAIAIGSSPVASGTDAIAIGSAGASASSAIAIGLQATAGYIGSVAIGCDHTSAGASANAQDEFVLGTANHIVIVKGKLVIADSLGGLHQVVVSTGGALSTVAYP